MKSLIVFCLVAFSSVSFAEQVDVKIISWQKIDPYKAAELCGQVSGDYAINAKVVATVDPGKYQGEYVSPVSPSGNFCIVVRSLTGRVKVDAYAQGTRLFASTEAERFNIP